MVGLLRERDVWKLACLGLQDTGRILERGMLRGWEAKGEGYFRMFQRKGCKREGCCRGVQESRCSEIGMLM